MGSKKVKRKRYNVNEDSAHSSVKKAEDLKTAEDAKNIEETKNIEEIKELKDSISKIKLSDDTASIIEEGLGDPVPEEVIDVEEYSRMIDEVYRHGDDSFMSGLDTVTPYEGRLSDEPKSSEGIPKSAEGAVYNSGYAKSSAGEAAHGTGYTQGGIGEAAHGAGYPHGGIGDVGYNAGYNQNGVNSSHSGSQPQNAGVNTGYPQNGGNPQNVGYNAGYPQNNAGNIGYNAGYPQSGGVNVGYNAGYPQNGGVNVGYPQNGGVNVGYNAGYPQNNAVNNGYNGGYPQNNMGNIGYNNGYPQNNGSYPGNNAGNMGYNGGYPQNNGRRNYDYYDDEPAKGSRTPLIVAITVASVAIIAAIAIIISNQNRPVSDINKETSSVVNYDETDTEKEDKTTEEERRTEEETTEESTTEEPTTEAPTTEEATTEAPTTEAPTTEEATTETPTTEAPTEPVTEEPATEYVPVQVDIVGKSYSYSNAPEKLAAVIAEARHIAGLADEGGVKSMKANQSKLYYDNDSNVIRIDLEPNSSYGNVTYEEFYFKDNKLIFADYYKDNVEFEDVTRFYYLDGKVVGYSETASDTVHFYSDGLNPADFAYSSGQPDLYSRAKALNSKMIA